MRSPSSAHLPCLGKPCPRSTSTAAHDKSRSAWSALLLGVVRSHAAASVSVVVPTPGYFGRRLWFAASVDRSLKNDVLEVREGWHQHAFSASFPSPAKAVFASVITRYVQHSPFPCFTIHPGAVLVAGRCAPAEPAAEISRTTSPSPPRRCSAAPALCGHRAQEQDRAASLGAVRVFARDGCCWPRRLGSRMGGGDSDSSPRSRTVPRVSALCASLQTTAGAGGGSLGRWAGGGGSGAGSSSSSSSFAAAAAAMTAPAAPAPAPAPSSIGGVGAGRGSGSGERGGACISPLALARPARPSARPRRPLGCKVL